MLNTWLTSLLEEAIHSLVTLHFTKDILINGVEAWKSYNLRTLAGMP
jgi:hypothetical protein